MHLPTVSNADGFLRHIRACQSAELPGRRLPFRIGNHQVGWLLPEFADALTIFPEIAYSDDAVRLSDPASLPRIARDLADQGHFRWRYEAFDVRADPAGPVIAQLDRGALPAFGVFAAGVHVNGLVKRAGALHVWIARRAADKMTDPGKLDHITAGGVSAGMTPEQTLAKEAEEEAAMPATLACRACHVATISYAMVRPEGLRRDLLYCYDLELPAAFCPHASDGEVEAFELWPISRVLTAVRETDDFKFNVNLVLIDLFLRRGLIEGHEAVGLRRALDRGRI